MRSTCQAVKREPGVGPRARRHGLLSSCDTRPAHEETRRRAGVGHHRGGGGGAGRCRGSGEPSPIAKGVIIGANLFFWSGLVLFFWGLVVRGRQKEEQGWAAVRGRFPSPTRSGFGRTSRPTTRVAYPCRPVSRAQACVRPTCPLRRRCSTMASSCSRCAPWHPRASERQPLCFGSTAKASSSVTGQRGPRSTSAPWPSPSRLRLASPPRVRSLERWRPDQSARAMDSSA